LTSVVSLVIIQTPPGVRVSKSMFLQSGRVVAMHKANLTCSLQVSYIESTHTHTHTHTHNSLLRSVHQGSHRPSFQPVLHRSSHLLQSKVSLPSFSLTALCASHIQVPNSLLLLTLGVFLLIQLWKSSAQTQQGYSLPNVERKDLVSVCNCGEGCVG
jgi:hypothetical protein